MDALSRLVTVLEQEVGVAEQLLGRMLTVRLLVAAGEARMLPRAGDELDLLSERLGAMELLRGAAVADLRTARGLDPLGGDWSLAALLEELEADPELPTIELRTVTGRLTAVVGEIADLQPEVAALLAARVEVVRDRWERLEQLPAAPLYGASVVP